MGPQKIDESIPSGRDSVSKNEVFQESIVPSPKGKLSHSALRQECV